LIVPLDMVVFRSSMMLPPHGTVRRINLR
jgi:hypothetical protein